MKTLPKQCDVCGKRFGLYKPFYTLQSKGHFWKFREQGEMAICPECYRAYQDFLQSRQEYFIYKNAKVI